MHWDVLRYSGDSHRSNLVYHIGFIAPLLLTTLWIKPLTRDPLTRNLYKGMKEPIMSVEAFETMRLYMVCFTIFYRLLIMPKYLQAYLNIAYDKVAELKQEAGKISNLELQRKVVRVFYYLCVVTLQYTAPMILILYLTFLYKTLGAGSWSGGIIQQSQGVQETPVHQVNEFQEVEVTPEAEEEDMEIGIGKIIQQEEAVEAITHQFSLAWISLKKVLNNAIKNIFDF